MARPCMAMLMLLAGAVPAAAADISGVWQVAGYFDVDRKARVDLTCTFKQDDKTLTGSCTGHREGAATGRVRGTVNDLKVDWTFEVDSDGQKETMTLAGTLDDGGTLMKGRLAAGGRDGPFFAQKE